MRVAIVGFGRIGRAVFRANLERKLFDVVAINDINPDINNLCYLLNYDSHYGRLTPGATVEDGNLNVHGQTIRILHHHSVHDVPWEELDVDVVIDSSGIYNNVLAAHDLIGRVRKVVITHSPDEVDHTIIFGANEETYNPAKHHVVSSSICDAVSVAPVLKLVDEAFGVQTGFLTTLHPWLSYQNLLDGPSVSWASPDQIYAHYAVGRASVGTLIPKPTSAIQAVSRVLPRMGTALQCMSFRVPTPVVGAANLVLALEKDTTIEQVRAMFEAAMADQVDHFIKLSDEPLVSVDFMRTPFSAVVDQRWTNMSDPRHLNLVLWYDNEWGYSSRVLDVTRLVGTK